MKTTKPISTISYNTPNYLRLKLEEFRRAGIVSFWCFISHLPEDDEGGLKEHMHVYMEPAKLLQTEDLKNNLAEFCPSSPDKPLGCISFHHSNFDNWYMYAIHDARYLASKGQTRRFHYSFDDIVCSDPDELNYNVRSIDLLSLSPYQDMIDAISRGVSWPEYFARGTIPFQQLRNFEYAFALLSGCPHTYRNGRDNHNEK